MKKLVLLIVLGLFAGPLTAQQLTYTPINPAFGGNPYNYSWMLSSANAQNQHKAPVDPREEESELDRLNENINRQLLSQISRSLLSEQLEGFDFNEEGTFTYGTLNMEIYRSLEGIVINILDTSTGEETQIIIPYT
ncbi:MAG: curli production assembly/transport component CsgF [Bacteroidota bacterium]